MSIQFEIRDRETGEVLREAETYSGGGGSGIISKVYTSGNELSGGTVDTKQLSYWDYPSEPDEWASEITGRDAVLVATAEVDDYGHVIRSFDAEGFDGDGRDWQGFDEWGIDKDGYDVDGYDENGFDREGIHMDTGTDRDPDGYDHLGCDENGRTREGNEKAAESASRGGVRGFIDDVRHALSRGGNGVQGMDKFDGGKETVGGKIEVAAHDRRLANGKVVHVKGYTRDK